MTADPNKLKKQLKSHLSRQRFEHTLGVKKQAVILADQFDLEIKKAEVAALLHDYAKEMPQKKIKQWALKCSWKIDELELELTSVLHAPVSAYLAREKFDISDREILTAIRFHAIGSPELSLLGKIIFLADMIEINRDFPGVNKLRKLAVENFHQALINACDNSLKYNLKAENIIHPNTLLMRNELLKGENSHAQNK